MTRTTAPSTPLTDTERVTTVVEGDRDSERWRFTTDLPALNVQVITGKYGHGLRHPVTFVQLPSGRTLWTRWYDLPVSFGGVGEAHAHVVGCVRQGKLPKGEYPHDVNHAPPALWALTGVTP